jgi:SNF2 family DNA or RNA helicase
LPARKIWKITPTLENFQYIEKWFPEANWDEATLTIRDKCIKDAEDRKNVFNKVTNQKWLNGYEFKTKPWHHQEEALAIGSHLGSFGYFMEMGTGKTKTLLDDAALNYKHGKIDALIIFCPNSVRTQWVNMLDPKDDEVYRHIPEDIPINKGCWSIYQKSDTKREWNKFWLNREADCLQILVMGISVASSTKSIKIAESFVYSKKCMICIDESTLIKNRVAKRSKFLSKLRRHCPVARIMSGTPVVQSPLNAFAQLNFLDPNIIGISNWTLFKRRYAVFNDAESRHVLFYQNIKELSDKISSCSFRVLKKDCLDLPPKIYQTRLIDLNKDQLTAYNSMVEELKVKVEDTTLTATIILSLMIRLQQITAGYLPILDDLGNIKEYHKLGHPTKIEELLRILDETDQKVVIWSRFVPELLEVQSQLNKAGIGNVLVYGGIKDHERHGLIKEFQEGEARIFIGNPATAGLGIQLYSGSTVIYLSNSFSLDQRLQSEDRVHRAGQIKAVNYIDLIAPNTIDVKILNCLRSKKRISDEIMKDGAQSWL